MGSDGGGGRWPLNGARAMMGADCRDEAPMPELKLVRRHLHFLTRDIYEHCGVTILTHLRSQEYFLMGGPIGFTGYSTRVPTALAKGSQTSACYVLLALDIPEYQF
ncbi:hypothetical protein SAY87_021870 [Trapa incisa]|uniref:Uncharacterized protein n=1 Tax=Trapa incisa TaxID=236973 RepID=A0AAN7JU62_9MYRT|nr:hypothetical protein SAY87_021870 [Trapa incisa]